MTQAPIPVATDDGFRNIKTGLADMTRLAQESRAQYGVPNQIAVLGDGQRSAIYKTDGKVYTVGSQKSDSTETDDYPYSNINRVLIHNALCNAGLQGKEIHLCTGLPLNRFYVGRPAVRNQELIDKKEASLKQSVIRMNDRENPDDGYQAPVVVKTTTLPQGMAAWFNYLITETKNGDGTIDAKHHRDREMAPVAFVDIGGRTTDVAVIEGASLDMARSGSIPEGMLKVQNILVENVRKKFGLNYTSDAQIDQMMRTLKVHDSGVECDISDLMLDAKMEVVERIYSDLQSRIGQGRELKEIMFIGGGSVALNKEITTWYNEKHGRVTDDPLFENASGMIKFLKYVEGSA